MHQGDKKKKRNFVHGAAFTETMAHKQSKRKRRVNSRVLNNGISNVSKEGSESDKESEETG